MAVKKQISQKSVSYSSSALLNDCSKKLARRGKRFYLLLQDEESVGGSLLWHDALYKKEQKGENPVVINAKKTATVSKQNEQHYILETGKYLQENALHANSRMAMRYVLSEFDVCLAGWEE